MRSNSILFLYCREDLPRIRILSNKLKSLGIDAQLPDDFIEPEQSFGQQFYDMLHSVQNIVVFVSHNSLHSKYFLQIVLRCEAAVERDKNVIGIIEWSNLLEESPQLQHDLAGRKLIYPEDGLHSEADYTSTAAILYDICNTSHSKEVLYEKISDFSRLKYIPGLNDCLSELVILLCKELFRTEQSSTRRTLYKEILRCMKKMEGLREFSYTNETRARAHKRLEAINAIQHLLDQKEFHSADLFYISYGIYVLELHYRILLEITDTLSNGDIHAPDTSTLEKNYWIPQKALWETYNQLMLSEKITESNPGHYTDDELTLILQARSHLLQISGEILPPKPDPESCLPAGEHSRILWEIAEYIQKCNKLLETIQYPSDGFIGCLKTSYERLKKYSETIGCMDICVECIEKIAELNHNIHTTEETSNSADPLIPSLRALLGLQSANSELYDVFISYKHEDIDLANNVYNFLSSNFLNIFFDKITLPELSKSEYEEAIMGALDHARHFIVIFSDLKYLESDWVSLEMKTFRHEIVEGRKANANFILIVTNDVYQAIVSTNKQCLPIQYRSYEILLLNQYKESLIKYLK